MPGPAVGRTTQVDRLAASDVHGTAARGVAGGGRRLPFLAQIQRAFGHHDVSSVTAHVGGEAANAAGQLQAHAYATGETVAFAAEPDLFMAAHEAAHVVQQRHGVSLAGGLDGGAGDSHEHHANEVARRVAAGDSAQDLLDAYGPPGGTAQAGQAVQRVGNVLSPAEQLAIPAIYAGQPTAQHRVTALEQSASPHVTYGTSPGTDEEAEITAGGSYLHRKKQDWRAELLSRQAGVAPNWQSWETFQYEMDQVTPNMQRLQAPWFMQGGGYNVTGAPRQNMMQQIAADRTSHARNQHDPQRLLGLTYQRDTMYTLGGQDINRHRGAFNAATPAATLAGWANDVAIIERGGNALRLRITTAVANGGNVRLTGRTVAGTHNPGPVPVNTNVRLDINAGTGAIAVQQIGGPGTLNIAAGWVGSLQSWAYYQSRTRFDEGVGAPGANGQQARNRDNPPALDDNTFDAIGARHGGGGERSTRRTLGPQRTRVNFHDAEVGYDLEVAPYRRLGGDAIFNEAPHPAPAAYQNQLQPAHTVNVNNPLWYFHQQNAMPNRFVGGRSNSTGLYMSSATMLFHMGRLTLPEAKDVLAFVIADMVVSGEHSMPECMTTVVQAAGSVEPWTATPLNLGGPTGTLRAWRDLVPGGTAAAMLVAARASLLALMNNPAPDLKLVKVMTLLIKALTAA